MSTTGDLSQGFPLFAAVAGGGLAYAVVAWREDILHPAGLPLVPILVMVGERTPDSGVARESRIDNLAYFRTQVEAEHYAKTGETR